jgi:serine/threonine protein kinase
MCYLQKSSASTKGMEIIMRLGNQHAQATQQAPKKAPPRHKNNNLPGKRLTFLDKVATLKFKQYLSALKDLPETELIYLITQSEDPDRRAAAYLHLIKSGNLADLQKLSQLINLDYCDEQGRNAVLTACINNRIDVLTWLIEDEEISLDVTDNDGNTPILLAIENGHLDLLHRLNTPTSEGGFGLELDIATDDAYTHPVMRAAFDDQPEVLHELVKPIDAGGFGLSLDVRDHHDFGLDAIAMQRNATKVLVELLKPADQGGLGCVIDTSNLITYYPDNGRGFNGNRYVVFYTAAKDTEAVVVLDTFTGNRETFHPEKRMGAGGFGSVMKFTFGTQMFAVKKPKHDWIKMREDQSDIDAYKNHKKWMKHEYKYLSIAYPDNGPYVLQQLRDIKKNLRRYSYRLIMPVVPGKELEKHQKAFRRADQIAVAFLRIAEEIQRIHNLGIIHGDIRTGNILIEPTKINGKEDISVHLLDFYMAHKIGKNAPFDDSNNPYVAPERLRWDVAGHPSQDVFSLAITFKDALSEIRRADKTIDSQLDKHFPAIKDLIKRGQSISISHRPSLPEFISTLRQQLHAYKAPTTTMNIKPAKLTPTSALRANSIFDSSTWDARPEPAGNRQKKRKIR